MEKELLQQILTMGGDGSVCLSDLLSTIFCLLVSSVGAGEVMLPGHHPGM